MPLAALIVAAALTNPAASAIDCPPGAIPEDEPCGMDLNPGCDGTPSGVSDCCYAHPTPGCDNPRCEEIVCAIDTACCQVEWDAICAAEVYCLCGGLCDKAGGGPQAWMMIASGQSVCGTLWATGGHDTDWFEFRTTSATSFVTVTLSSASSVSFGIADTDGQPLCALADSLDPFAVSVPGRSASITACVPAGVHWIALELVQPTGIPCGSPLGEYVLTLSVVDETCTLPDPVNDACDGAIEIFEGSTLVSTVGAGDEPRGFEEDCDGFAHIHGDVWFRHVATRTGTLRVATCGTCTFDARLLAYSGPCGVAQLMACDDDGFGCAFSDPGLDLAVTAGESYLLRFGGLSDSDGEATLTLSYLPCSPAYTLEVICFGPIPHVIGKGISPDGEVVGERLASGASNTISFRWTPEIGYVDVLGSPTFGSLTDVNSAGVAVGWIKDGPFPAPAYAPGNQLIALPLPAETQCTKGEARGINERGDMIGDTYGFPCLIDVLAWSDGTLVDVVFPVPALHGLDVNESGAMMGDGNGPATGALQPWTLEGTRFTWLPPLILGKKMTPIALTNQGRIVGHIDLDQSSSPQTLAFVWDDGAYETIAPNDGFASSSAKDMNDDGELLLEFDTGGSSAAYAPFVRRGGAPVALHSLIGADTGWELIHVAAINASGQIAGTVRKGSHLCAARLTPVPPRGDFDCDGFVDAGDLATLLGAWGACAVNATCAADLTIDGV